MAGAMLAVLLSERAVDLDYIHRVGDQEFRFDSAEIRKELEDIPLTHPRVREWLSGALREGEVNLQPVKTDRRLTF